MALVILIWLLMVVFAIQMAIYLLRAAICGLWHLFLRVFLDIRPRDPLAPPPSPEATRAALTKEETYRRYRALFPRTPPLTATGRWKTARY